MNTRSTADVFDDHLARAQRGDVAGDIASNFAPDCVLLTTYGRFDGHRGCQDAADLLARQVPNGQWTYTQRSVHGDIAFLEWTGRGDGAVVRDGADTFLVRDGLVRVMTIHYTVDSLPAAGEIAGSA